MHHAYNSVKNLPPCTGEFEGVADAPEVAQKALDIMKSMYQVYFPQRLDKYIDLEA